MVTVTVHQMRCLTLQWAYSHAPTLVNGSRARMLIEHGWDAITSADSRAYLVAVMTTVDFLREQTDEAEA